MPEWLKQKLSGQHRCHFFVSPTVQLLLDPNSGDGGGGSSDGGDGGGGGSGGGAGDAGDGGQGSSSGGQSGGGSASADANRRFTQDDVNRMLAQQKRDSNAKHLQEVNKMREAQGITQEERDRLDSRAKELENELMTREERNKKEIESVRSEASNKVKAAEEQRDRNWQLFVGTKVNVDIAAAATKHKAYNLKQVEALVGPLCVVEELKDDKLHGTGEYRVSVKVKEAGDDGKVEEKILSVDKYLEGLKEKEEFQNLFLSDRPGGTGFRPGSKKTGDGKDMTPTNKIAVGLGKRG